MTILRDGGLIRTAASRDETESTLIEGMLGRSLGSVFPDRPAPPDAHAPVALAVSGLTAPGVRDASLRVRCGEIVGVAGLVGSGRTELARAITGAVPVTGGEMRLQGRRVAVRTPRAALAHGIVMIPESRKEQGLVAQRSIVENVTLATLPAYSTGALVRRRRERRAAHDALESVNVRTTTMAAPVSTLSGGNQQKALFARALLCAPKVVIADEPTRGVDVGSRRAIYDALVREAGKGAGVVVISSDVEEVLGLAHRVLVMRAGRIVAELAGPELTEQHVLTAAFADAPRATDER